MANLLQTIMSTFTPDITAQLAGSMGESPAAVGRGLTLAAPALLAGALQRSATPSGAGSLLDLVNQATAGGFGMERLGAVAGDEGARNTLLSRGQNLVSGLFGGNAGPVASSVASQAGVGAGAGSSILALAAPLVLGALGRAAGPSPTPSGLQSLLNGERSNIMGALPAGLGSMLGLGGAARAASASAADTGRASRGGMGGILPWLLGGAAIVALLLGMQFCTAQRKVEVTSVTPPAVQLPSAPKIPMVTLSLPGGGAIQVPQGSIGFGLAKFLESPDPAPKTFVFDNLNYDTASRALTPESQPTVTAIASILKAYPSARVRVVGYTDNQGDPASNKQLSEQRAATVKSELARLGISADRVEAAGMGEAKAIADNSTEAGRAQNRRTELEVVAK